MMPVVHAGPWLLWSGNPELRPMVEEAERRLQALLQEPTAS